MAVPFSPSVRRTASRESSDPAQDAAAAAAAAGGGGASDPAPGPSCGPTPHGLPRRVEAAGYQQAAVGDESRKRLGFYHGCGLNKEGGTGFGLRMYFKYGKVPHSPTALGEGMGSDVSPTRWPSFPRTWTVALADARKLVDE